MTIHDFIRTLTKPKPVPSNCDGAQLVYYAKARFGRKLVVFTRNGRKYIGEECPACGATQ